MRILLAFLCIALIAFIPLSARADSNEIRFYEPNSSVPTYHSRFPIDFGWIVGDYEFDWIEEYIDEYYGTYYKHWERYLTDKQREFASKFGLSSILLKPNLKRYESTKVVLSKSIWGDKLLLRYLAPAGDMQDFEFFVSIKPHRAVTLTARGHVNGEQSIAVVVRRPIGGKRGNGDIERRAKKLLRRVKRLAKYR